MQCAEVTKKARMQRMNKVILIGRLTKDPEVRYTQDNTAIARYALAVDRRFKKEGEAQADFINCVAFGMSGEFAEKYLRKGMRIAVTGRIQTGSYTDKDGRKVYTTDIVVEEHEFCESKSTGEAKDAPQVDADGFMIPDGLDEIDLPF